MKNTTTTTKQVTTDSGKIITVSIERGTWTTNNTLDGQVTSAGTHLVNNLTITIVANGKTASTSQRPSLVTKNDKAPAGAYAHLMSVGYMTEQVYNTIMTLLAEIEAEAGKTAEYIAIEQAQIAKMNKIEADWAEADQTPKGGGWCEKCQSNCYGDCQS